MKHSRQKHVMIGLFLIQLLFILSSCGEYYISDLKPYRKIVYGTVTDADKYVYKTVTIGTQTWMAQNLCVTRFRNNQLIPNIESNADWITQTSAAQCSYDNTKDETLVRKYGRLYNYYAVSDPRSIAPNGWHVATDSDWIVLRDYLSTHTYESSTVAKAMSINIEWLADTTLGVPGNVLTDNNSSGFSAYPAGYREVSRGEFAKKYSGSFWWVTPEVNTVIGKYYTLQSTSKELLGNTNLKQFGFSVRCVRDK
jgi:uncharacterized protein (TIGR02145 family)